MLREFLVVGLGGSGTLTLRYLQQALGVELERVGLPRTLPDCWSLLGIDTVRAEGNRLGACDAPPLDHCVGLGVRGLSYDDLSHRLVDHAHAADAGAREKLASWVPPPGRPGPGFDLSLGAGQSAAIGRAIGAAHLDHIHDALEGAVAAGPAANQAMVQVSRAFGFNDGPAVSQPAVIVVASLAGGAGAGLLLDVCDMLQAAAIGFGPVAFLYTPDVFDSIDERGRPGMPGNALAALSEIMAGRWATALEPTGTEALAQQAGYSPAIPRGPEATLLIDRSHHQDPGGVFRATARGLARLMTSESSTKDALWHLGNPGPSTSQTRLAGPEDLFRPVAFAQVSLGRERFLDYALMVIARQSESTLLPTNDSEDRAAVARKVEDSWPAFLGHCGLSATDVARPTLVDALRANALRLEDLRDRLGRYLLQQGPVPPHGWPQWVARQLGEHGPAILADMRADTVRQARQWALEAQTRIVNEVGRAGAIIGLPAALALIDRLRRQELPSLRDRLQVESLRFRAEAETLGRGAAEPHHAPVVVGLLAYLLHRDRIRNEIGQRRATGLVHDSLQNRHEADVCEVAAALVRDLADGFIAPLSKALESTVMNLKEQRPADGVRLPDILLSHYLDASPATVFLDRVEEYPATLESLLVDTLPEPSGGSPLLAAARETSRNVLAEVLTPTRPWIPALPGDPTGEPPQQAAFEVRLTPEGLGSSARSWIFASDRGIGPYAREGLRSYLDAPGESQRERWVRFLSGLETALKMALESMGPRRVGLMRVHLEGGPRIAPVLTELPYSPASPRGAETSRLLQRLFGVIPNLAECPPARDIDAVGIMLVTHPPIDLPATALADSVARSWATVPPERRATEHFWRWRRTRPLPAFVPVPTDTRLRLMRGWFVANLLGLLRYEAPGRTESGVAAWAGRLEILDPEEGRPFAFPFPLLTPQPGRHLLPAVLESLPLALVQIGTHNHNALRPYQALLALGELERGKPGLFLASVLAHGARPEHLIWLREHKKGEAEARLDPALPPGDRRALIRAFLEQERGHSQQMFQQMPPRTAPGSGIDEIGDDIESALEDLIAALAACRP